jgi:hypothetical protein
MKTKALASLIAKLEGKKSQARIGDIREIISVIGIILLGMDQAEIDATVLEIIKGAKRQLNKSK